MTEPTQESRVSWLLIVVVVMSIATAGGVYYYQFIYLAPGEGEEVGPQERIIEVTASQWKFEPNEIVVNKGDTVILRITSSLDADPSFDAHGFLILGYDVPNTVLPKGEVVEVKFVADKAGSYPFICTIFCGEGHTAMQGTLIVEG